MAHSRLAPSSASRWVFCPGSISMGERYADEGTEGAEGTACHWAGAEMLRGNRVLPGDKDPDSTVLTMEMIDGAWVYSNAVARHISSIIAAGGQTPQLMIEQPIAIPSVHPECWGTPDLWYFTGQELHVWDLKYGWGIVEAQMNWQAICYTSGILDYLATCLNQAPGLMDQYITVVIHIAQPRPYHVMGAIREWRVAASDLRGPINQLTWAASAALSGEANCNTGTHCRYCNARHACAAAQKSAMYCVDFSDFAVPDELDETAMGAEYKVLQRALKAIEYRMTGLEAKMIATIQAGGHIPGWGIDRGKGRLAWTKPVNEVFALGDLMGVDLRKPQEPITPTQARDKGLDLAVIHQYAEAPSSGIKLVPQDKTVAARIFGA